MALEVKDIKTIGDMQRFVEGCVNDLETGEMTRDEFLDYMYEYTNKVKDIGYEIGYVKGINVRSDKL
jgi:phage host-nuclease inhibitor protein Gam